MPGSRACDAGDVNQDYIDPDTNADLNVMDISGYTLLSNTAFAAIASTIRKIDTIV